MEAIVAAVAVFCMLIGTAAYVLYLIGVLGTIGEKGIVPDVYPVD
jgi:hypothetical protein